MLPIGKVFDVSENEIRTNYPCRLVIDMDDYDVEKEELAETHDSFVLPGAFEIYFPEFKDVSYITLKYNVTLLKPQSIQYEGSTVILNYQENDILIKQEYIQKENTGNGVLGRFFRGRIKYIKDMNLLLNMVGELVPSSDLVHLELILSNMIRDEDGRPARMTGKYKNTVIVGQETQIKEDSWLSSIAYKRIDSAVKKGLVDGASAIENPIEKVLNENFKN